MNVAGECGDDYSLFRIGEHFIQLVPYRALRRRITFALGIGTVAHEKKNSFFCRGSNTGDVEQLTVDRREVEFEVAGVHHFADRTSNNQTK